MASWLSRATEAFRKPAPAPAPDPYNVRCDCGGFVVGVRVTAAQRPSCPDCGRQVFVLPANPYPPRSKPKTPEIVPSIKATEQGIREAQSVTTPAKPERRVNPAQEPPAPVNLPNGILLEARTKILTPFRTIVLAIAVIGTVTGWGLWHRHRVESAKASVLAANEAGMKGLKEGNFVVAARELTRARDAVDLLRRTDPEANTIRRYSREAIAGNGVAKSSPFEILAEYVSESRLGKSRFASLHRDAWLVLDVNVANPEAADRPCLLDMPIPLDGMTFRIEVDSAAIRTAALREQENGTARIIFAAQMNEIRPPSAENPNATLVLNGKSAFLWTTLETYMALGYAEEQADELQLTRDLLARQLQQVETAK